MTVGESLPVSFSICTRPRARSARDFSAFGAESLCFETSFSNFSRYIRIVAPAEPVPLRRKTTRAESPFGYSNPRISPWLVAFDPSTGSVYLQRSRATSKMRFPSTWESCSVVATHENSSAFTSLMFDSSLAALMSPLMYLSLIKSITLFASFESTPARRER